MLEKTEGAIKNGQSRDTGNIATQDTGWRQTKQKTQHRKKKDEELGPQQKPGVNPGGPEG
jgi:hypothetical protein